MGYVLICMHLNFYIKLPIFKRSISLLNIRSITITLVIPMNHTQKLVLSSFVRQFIETICTLNKINSRIYKLNIHEKL